MSTEQFEAIGVHSFQNWLEPKRFSYSPQDPRPDDVDIQVECCGICGSDIHAANGDWGEPFTPLAVGHEIIGKVVKIGPEVTRCKIGDRVGVGAQCDSCGSCKRCTNHHENTCRRYVDTYLDKYPETGTHTQGGYAKYIRTCQRFVFKIPEKLDSIHAAPLLCGGMTGFRPLLTAGVTKGTKVGVSGIGGIGHMTILFAKALGAEVTAISRTDKKKDLAYKLGADHFISRAEKDYETKYVDTLDVIVNTGSAFSEGAVQEIAPLLNCYGKFIYITCPPLSERIDLNPFLLITNDYSIAGSNIGSPKDIEYMLQFAADHGIKPWVETIDISEENVSIAWKRMVKGDVEFRFVLTGYDKCFTN